MRTWEDYKTYAKGIDEQAKKDIEEMETIASIISSIISRRNSLGISQRELACKCGMPQSSVARIESLKTTPNLVTLIKLMKPLGLELSVVCSKNN